MKADAIREVGRAAATRPDPDSRPRVLIVTPTRSAYDFLHQYCQRLLDTGHDVHYASSADSFGSRVDADPRLVFHEVAVPRGANIVSHLRAASGLSALVKRLRPDALEVHFSAATLSAALSRVGRSAQPVAIATVHGLRYPLLRGLRGRLERLVETRALARMDRAIVLTADDLESLTRAGLRNAEVQSSYGVGCDIARFDSRRFPADARATIRRELGIGPTDPVIVFVGRFVRFKGFDTAVRAFRRARERIPRATMLLCGVFDPIHPSGLSPAEERALVEDENVRVLGWVSDVERVLAISQVCLFPSTREGLPVNLMEALSMGVPVITSDSRGCRDVVRSGTDGFVLPEGDEEAFLEALMSLLTDESRRERFSAAAIDGRARFDRSVFVAERVALLQSVLSERHERVPAGRASA